MPHGFYELLGVSAGATTSEIEAAYDKELAALVRRMRHARQQGADVRILEAREQSLREARTILTDPARRRRYDAFRAASDQGLPSDVEELWQRSAEALVDPVAVSALRVVRTLTDLPVGDPFPGVPEPAPPPLGASLVGSPPAAPAPPAAPVATPTAAEAARGSWPGLPEPSPTAVPDEPEIATLRDPDAASPDTTPGLNPAPRIQLPPDMGLDPLEELLADLSGTDPGLQAAAAPLDPIDRYARDYGYDGRFLKAVREYRGLSLDAMSATTRISARYLEALEANGFDQLPAATFVRGYLKEVVRVLDLGDRDAVGGYMALFHRHRG